MPSENKTHNIGLNQWQGNEYPKRQDFVDDNIKIDEKIGSINTTVEEFQRAIENIEVPVISVNDKTGAVELTASDVGASPIGHGHAYSDISGKPSTFPPSTHGHTYSEISGKPTAFPPTAHGHTPDQVGLGNVLNYGIATTAEAQAGVVNNKYVTPALVKAAVQHLATTGGISMVKSVQRGVTITNYSNAGSQGIAKVNISPVNTSKSMVNILSIGENSMPHKYSPRISLANSGTIEFMTGYYNERVDISWEVIEFY